MNSIEYWQRRFIQEKAAQLHSQQQYQAALNKRLDQLLIIYDKEIKYWYGRYAAEFNITMKDAADILEKIEYKHFNNTLEEFKAKALKGGHERELNAEYFKSQISRLNQLESQFKQQAENLFSVEKFKFLDEMVLEYQSTYLHDIYNIQSYRGIYDTNFSTLDTEQLRHVLSEPWSRDTAKKGVRGNFSERLWGNLVEELPSQLMDSMLRQTLSGNNFGKMKKEFKQRFNTVKDSHINRLVITEMGHATEEATAAAYKSQDLEKYQYMATFERRTCDICGSLHGQVFYLKDKVTGKNYPLIHPYCRCTTVPYIAGEPAAVKRWADGKIIDGDISFNEWKAKAA